jgi:hypothetical protein
VEDKKMEYFNASTRKEKMAISRDIVSAWRDQNPPGRFLIKDELNTGLWNDVGDQKAREKISQALREKGPEFRRHHGMRQNDMDDTGTAKPNTPRSAVVSKQHSSIFFFFYISFIWPLILICRPKKNSNSKYIRTRASLISTYPIRRIWTLTLYFRTMIRLILIQVR